MLRKCVSCNVGSQGYRAKNGMRICSLGQNPKVCLLSAPTLLGCDIGTAEELLTVFKTQDLERDQYLLSSKLSGK